MGYATDQTGPVMAASRSVNSFIPEAVIISRSFARVMPRRRCAMPGRLCRGVSCSGRPGFGRSAE